MIPAIADQSDMPLWPAWFWVLLLTLTCLVAVLLWVTWPTKNAAPARDEAGTVPARALTNSACALRGHSIGRFADGPVWICWREGCGETWFVLPEQQPFDQVVAEAEAIARGAAS